MAAEMKNDAREGGSRSPSRSPVLKKRIAQISHGVIEGPPFDSEKSIENRKIFLAPFLHYQAILAASSRPTVFSREQITRFKKIACPPEEISQPYYSHKEELDDIAGKYSRLITDFRKRAFPKDSPEFELISEIEKTFSQYIRQKQEEEEKYYQAKQKEEDERNQQRKIDADKKRAHEISIALEEERNHLKNIIANRLDHLAHALEQLSFSPEQYPDFQQIIIFIGRLSSKEISIIQKHLPALRLDYVSINEPINNKLRAKHHEIYQEMSELETLQNEVNSINDPLTLMSVSSKIDSRTLINQLDFGHEIQLITNDYQNLSEQLNTISEQNKRRLTLRCDALKKTAESLKRKYDAKKSDQNTIMDKKYHDIALTYGVNNSQVIRKRFATSTLLSDQSLDNIAHDLTKTIWNRILLLNLIPAIQKRHKDRKNILLGYMNELKRYQLLYNQYAVIAEAVSINGDISQANADLNKMISASLNIETYGKLIALPTERQELIEFVQCLNEYQEQFQDQQELHQIQGKLNSPVFQRGFSGVVLPAVK